MAVYTEVSDDDLKALSDAYDIGEIVSCKGIAEGVENSNFLIETTRGPYILTLYEKRVDPKDLPFFLGFMEHLSLKGCVACPVPIKGRDGQSLRTIAGRPGAVISFLRGIWPRRITPEHCAEVGTAMAKLHNAGLSYPGRRANNLSVEGWQQLASRIPKEIAAKVDITLPRLMRTELEALSAAWPQLDATPELPSGVIHADLFPDNVFFLDGKCSGLIDFYFACTDFLAYDVAICLNAWCFEPDGAFNITKAKRMFASYEAVRPLSALEKQTLPLFARGSALRFMLTRLYDWANTPPGAMVKPKDPREYLHKLNFHRRVKDISAYGLA
ncbi:MAG: homoserine kinase [Rhodospirillaceae bacterium]